MATNLLPLSVFPGFTNFGVVSDQVKEIATTFNAEGLEALTAIPEKATAWADVGTRVTKAALQGKIPIRLTSLLGFEPFEGERKGHMVNVASVSVKVNPWHLGLEWPLALTQSGIPQLEEFYGVAGLAGDVVSHGRAFKADLVASLLIAGQTNAALSMTAKAFTLPQPGLPNGLPLFSDGVSSGSAQHYANPMDARSKQFKNLYLGFGKIGDGDNFGTVMQNFAQIPHASKANMTMGLEVTDIIGPTSMLIPFYRLAVQQLSLQTFTSPTNGGVATTNIYNKEVVEKMGPRALIGASGVAPWQFWIAPQLDSHPYMVANPTKQMFYAVSQTRKSLRWAELAGQNNLVPSVTLMGDGTENAKRTRKVELWADLDGGIAAGLPHAIQAYFEVTPA